MRHRSFTGNYTTFIRWIQETLSNLTLRGKEMVGNAPLEDEFTRWLCAAEATALCRSLAEGKLMNLFFYFFCVRTWILI
jgi:hypothetical protein